MIDDLRTTKKNPEDPNDPFPQAEEIVNASSDSEAGGNFLGMSAGQRFVIVILLFVLTCILGSFGLILTEKVVLPFF
ncbi:MAG: hypothetical protein JEZ00_14805 [Anaerolineaceae bacterium]|nr:hypothetical protein [Anaerolineaceae bacterium]